jgi:hypothetical protein
MERLQIISSFVSLPLIQKIDDWLSVIIIDLQDKKIMKKWSRSIVEFITNDCSY